MNQTTPTDLRTTYGQLLDAYRGGSLLLADEKLRLAEELTQGGCLDPDSELAARLVGEAAAEGHPLAMIEMASRSGRDGAVTPESVGWLRRGADAGEVQAMFLLGVSLVTGEGHPAPREDEGWSWIGRAAARFYPDALYQLALYHHNRDNATLAKFYELEALNTGCEAARNAINHFFGSDDLNTEGVIDTGRVVANAAAGGDPQALFEKANAAFNRQPDMQAGPSAEVVALLDQSVAAGFAEAIVNRAEIALAKRDVKLAMELLERGVDAGHYAAKGMLGRLMVEKNNDRRGRELTIEALNFGYPPALQIFARKAAAGEWPRFADPLHAQLYQALFWQTLGN